MRLASRRESWVIIAGNLTAQLQERQLGAMPQFTAALHAGFADKLNLQQIFCNDAPPDDNLRLRRLWCRQITKLEPPDDASLILKKWTASAGQYPPGHRRRPRCRRTRHISRSQGNSKASRVVLSRAPPPLRDIWRGPVGGGPGPRRPCANHNQPAPSAQVLAHGSQWERARPSQIETQGLFRNRQLARWLRRYRPEHRIDLRLELLAHPQVE